MLTLRRNLGRISQSLPGLSIIHDMAILVKTVKISHNKTVGYLRNRYRLGHWWVPVMVLNVQSDLSLFFYRLKTNTRSSMKPIRNFIALRYNIFGLT